MREGFSQLSAYRIDSVDVTARSRACVGGMVAVYRSVLDLPVSEVDGPAGVLSDLFLMGHDDDGVPLPVQLDEDAHDLLTRF